MIGSLSPELMNGTFAIGGAIIGALIAGGFSVWIFKKSETKKQVTLSHSFPSNLIAVHDNCLLYTSPSPRDRQKSRMPSSA